MFVARMRKALEARPDTIFFLSTDDPREEDLLTAAFPGKIVTSPKTGVRRDTVEGVQAALLDWLALARTNLILRSPGTSFSREAALASGVPRETIKRRFWPYDRPQYWREALRRRVAVIRRRMLRPKD